MESTTKATLAAALAWHDAGCCVLPTRSDGSKAPTVTWTEYQRQRYPRERLDATVREGFGLLCGAISGGLEMVELEGRAVTEGCVQTLQTMIGVAGLGSLWARLTAGPEAYVEQTPSGGIHILYRLADAPVPGNTKLASRPARPDELTVDERAVLANKPDKVFIRGLAETRGEGGYVVVAPSNGSTHATGLPWSLKVGTFGTVPTVTADERARLHALFRGLDQMPTKPLAPIQPKTAPTRSSPTDGSGRPGDDFNAKATWDEILTPHGWREHNRVDHITYWTRPGKDSGPSASTNAVGTDTLHIFTSSTEFDADANHDKFGAYAILNHHGDFEAATRALAAQGYGDAIDHGARQRDLIAAILGPDRVPDDPPHQGGGAGPPSRFFAETGGLLVQTLSQAIRVAHPCALTQEHQVAVYSNGAYRLNGMALSAVTAGMLGDRFRPAYRAAATEFIAGSLYTENRILPMHATEPFLNVSNGMLDLATGVLKPHDPSFLSSVQIPVMWDPDATCPRYEQWLADMIPDQTDDLEETISTMLDPSRTPTKAVFCFGPSRSGKSTFLRLAAAIAGADNVSAVTIHQLTQNRFAAANVFGKILNSAADVSAGHVDDISIFKMLTGEDPIHADRKYGGQFTFTNRALFAFSANELPTVGESSRAYVERIKPFGFIRSFAGREDPSIEVAMMTELPGILARWVRAYQRLGARGHRLATPDAVRKEFEERSDRVRQWVADCCEITGGRAVTPDQELPATDVTARRFLARQFNAWAREQGGSPMGERKILDRLTSIDGVFEVRSSLDRSRGLNLRVTELDTMAGLL